MRVLLRVALALALALAGWTGVGERIASAEEPRWHPDREQPGEYARHRAKGAEDIEFIRALADRFWPEDADRAVCIAWYESKFHAGVTGRWSPDYGLWQINERHYDGTWHWFVWGLRFDPWANAAQAHVVWRDAGRSWWPWAAFSVHGYCRHV